MKRLLIFLLAAIPLETYANENLTIQKHCDITSLVVREMAVQRDKGTPYAEALKEIPNIVSQIDDHLKLNSLLNETTKTHLTSTLSVIYARPDIQPEVFYSSFHKGCSGSNSQQ